MNPFFTTALAVAILGAGTAETGTIPEPDVILYGQVCLATGPATDQSDVSVIARSLVDGQVREIGRYKMGETPSASDCQGSADCYVLRMRVETVPTGATSSGTAVVLDPATPNTVDVFVKQGAAAEELAVQVTVSDRGVIQRANLRADPLSADIDGDGQKNLVDYALLKASLAGPATMTTQICDRADINRDGRVDLRDYALLQDEFLGSGG